MKSTIEFDGNVVQGRTVGSNKSNDVLGRLKWYGPWRQYCFFPEPFAELVFNVGCLQDICAFIGQLR